MVASLPGVSPLVLTAFPGRWSLLGARPQPGRRVGAHAGGGVEAEAVRVSGPWLWLASAGAAVLLAQARNHQGRRTTLLFGSPSNIRLAIGGAALCLVLRALERRLRAATGERSSELMLPVVFLSVMEGGDASIAIGNGFFAAWLLWDAVDAWWARGQGRALRTIGLLAQGALLTLFLVPRWDLRWVRAPVLSTAVGGGAALAALAILGPRVTRRWRLPLLVVLPAVVVAIELLRRGPLGETAVEIGLTLLLLTSLVSPSMPGGARAQRRKRLWPTA